MASVMIRNLPDEVHRAIKARAAVHGQSTEAEIREILAHAVKPEKRIRVGDALAAIGRQAGLTDKDVDRLSFRQSPAQPLSFGE